jgi:Flp pilus assembly protein TadG
MKLLLGHHDRNDLGAAAVEMALVLPILILLLGGIIDFGFAFNTQISLTHAAREGVRVEAIGTGGDGEAAAIAAFSAPAATNIAASVTRACPSPDGARLEVTANSRIFFLSFLPFISNPIPLEGQAVMRCGG